MDALRRPLVARLRRWVGREVVHRRLPHGLVHWRYLTVSPPAPLARQREMWWRSLPRLPRPLWIALEGWLWLRWQLWSGPLSVVRAVRRAGPRVREEEGIGLLLQARLAARVALGYCVPAFEVYRHRLYRPENRAHVGELIYDHTAEALRNLLDGPGAAARASMQVLLDKERQTAELAAIGVPVAPISAVARRGAGPDLERYLAGGQPVFCKPRHGSAGVGAFSAQIIDGVLTLDPLGGPPLQGQAGMAWWRLLLGADDMLVQPKLSVHPELAAAACEHDIVTTRYITRRGLPSGSRREEVEPYCATLELPAGVDDRTERQRSVLSRIPTPQVPGWGTIRDASALAQRYFAVSTRSLGTGRSPPTGRCC